MTRAGAGQVRSTRSVMDQAHNFTELIREVVLNPNLGTGLMLFLTSFLNELVAIFPYAVVLAGQMAFLESGISTTFLIKLIVFVAIPVGVGSALGVIPVYALAYIGGKPAIEKFHKYLRFSWNDVEKIGHRMTGHWYDEIIFLLLRSIPILPSLPLSIAAGILRMRLVPYIVLSIAGMIIRMLLSLLVVGIGVHGLSQFVIFLYTS